MKATSKILLSTSAALCLLSVPVLAMEKDDKGKSVTHAAPQHTASPSAPSASAAATDFPYRNALARRPTAMNLSADRIISVVGAAAHKSYSAVSPDTMQRLTAVLYDDVDSDVEASYDICWWSCYRDRCWYGHCR